MTGEGSTGTNPSSNQKPYGVVNIKTHVPIVLDYNELNYDAWRELFETHCRGYRVLGFLTGTSKPKADDDEEWYTLDSIVKSWIYATLTQSLLTSIVKKNSTAHSVWQSLEDLFRENKDTRAIELENELRFTTQGDLSIAQYCQKMKGISDLLANIENPIPEKSFVAHLLNGLSPQFDNISMLLRHRDPFPTYLQVRSKLLVEEKRLKTNRPTQPSHSDHSSSPSVLYAGNPSRAPSNSGRGGRRPNQPRRGGGNSDSRRQQLTSSGMQQQHPLPWSSYPMPWQPFPWPYPPFWPGFRPTSATQHRRPNAPSQQQSQQGLLGTPPSPSTGPTAAFHATTTPTFQPPWQWFPPMSQDQPTDLAQAFNSMSINDGIDANWYMDTGATSHLASDTGFENSSGTA